MNKGWKTEHVHFSVIERQLLARLKGNDSVAAVLLRKEDLRVVLNALQVYETTGTDEQLRLDLVIGLKQLQEGLGW